jgi:hypothetical protein
MYDKFCADTQGQSIGASTDLGRWVLVEGYHGMMNDPTCVTQIYDDFVGGTTTNGNIGSTNFGIASNYSIPKITQNTPDLLLPDPNSAFTKEERAQGFVRLSTGSGFSGGITSTFAANHTYLYMGNTSSSGYACSHKFTVGTIWECLVRIPVNHSEPHAAYIGIADNYAPWRKNSNTGGFNHSTFGSTFVGFVIDKARSASSGFWGCYYADGALSTGAVGNYSSVINSGEWTHLKMVKSYGANDIPQIKLFINGTVVQIYNTSVNDGYSGGTDGYSGTNKYVLPFVGGIVKYSGFSDSYLDIDFVKYTVIHPTRRYLNPLPYNDQYSGYYTPQDSTSDNYSAANVDRHLQGVMFLGLGDGQLPNDSLPIIT